MERLSVGGGLRSPRVTEERKPDDCRARRRFRCRFVEGMEVRPRRALEAFCRCEHTWARFTRDISEGVIPIKSVGWFDFRAEGER